MSPTKDIERSPEPSLTRAQFCELEQISHSTYTRMRRAGHGPVEMRIPGVNLIRITPKARADWHARMAKLADSRAMRLEAERRSAMARHAAMSPRKGAKP
jgi:hypothetical protein